MRNLIFRKTLLAGLIFMMPIVALVPGCGGGGGGGGVVVPSIYAGSYTGTYAVTAGPNTGETGVFALTIANSGAATATLTDASGTRGTFAGSVNNSTGAFALSGGSFPAASVASGLLVKTGAVVTGTGTFQLSNGNSGTLTIP